MSAQERSADYLASFQTSSAALAARIGPGSTTWSPTEISLDLAKLKRTLVDAAEYLPRYDQRQLETQIKALESSFEDRKLVSAPKSRFAFKNKKPPAPASSAPSTPLAPSPPPPAPEPASSSSSRSSNEISISHLSNQLVTLPPLPCSHSNSSPETDDAGVGLDLEDLTGCLIDLRPTAGTSTILTALHVKDLKGCVLLAPRVRGSVMLSGCEGCLIVLGGWQFRMHASKKTEIFLHTDADSSTPIIEGCTEIGFGPYILTLSDEKTEQDETPNLPHPLDFSHPNPSFPSPNWSHLSPEQIDNRRTALSALLDRLARNVPVDVPAELRRLLSREAI